MAEDQLPRYLEQLKEIKDKIQEFRDHFSGKIPGRSYSIQMSTFNLRVKAIASKIKKLGKKHNIVVVHGKIDGKDVRIYYSDVTVDDVLDLVRVDFKEMEFLSATELSPGKLYYLK